MDYLLALELQNYLVPFIFMALFIWFVFYPALKDMLGYEYADSIIPLVISAVVGLAVSAFIVLLIASHFFKGSVASADELKVFISNDDCHRHEVERLLDESMSIVNGDLLDIEHGCDEKRELNQVITEQRKALDQGDPDAH